MRSKSSGALKPREGPRGAFVVGRQTQSCSYPLDTAHVLRSIVIIKPLFSGQFSLFKHLFSGQWKRLRDAGNPTSLRNCTGALESRRVSPGVLGTPSHPERQKRRREETRRLDLPLSRSISAQRGASSVSRKPAFSCYTFTALTGVLVGDWGTGRLRGTRRRHVGCRDSDKPTLYACSGACKKPGEMMVCWGVERMDAQGLPISQKSVEICTGVATLKWAGRLSTQQLIHVCARASAAQCLLPPSLLLASRAPLCCLS